MSALVEFLDEMFGLNCNASHQDLIALFECDLGVKVQIEDGLFQFKYDMISVKWNAVTKECRGSILKRDLNGHWHYVARTPDKFYNLREGACPYSDEKIFKNDLQYLKLVEKADGTAIVLYNHEGSWKVSTLGKINPLAVGDFPFTFSDLFKTIVGEDGFNNLDPNYTYFLELCTTYNQVVTSYESNRVYYITARHNATGEYISDAAPQFQNMYTLRNFSVEDLKIDTLVGLEEFAEAESVREDLYGKVPEGFVLYNRNTPVAKIKNNKYLVYHRLCTGNAGYTIRNLNEIIFAGNIDDFYGDLNDTQKIYIDNLRAFVRNLQGETSKFCETIADGLSRKDFALTLEADEHLKHFKGFFFMNYDKIVKGETPSISEWLSGKNKNGAFVYESYHDTWKSLFKI